MRLADSFVPSPPPRAAGGVLIYSFTRTFARWASGETSKNKPRKPGRPRKPEETRQLILQMAKDNAWGTKRILGELNKLRIGNISRSKIARILKENGFEPAPKRHRNAMTEPGTIPFSDTLKRFGRVTSSPRRFGRLVVWLIITCYSSFTSKVGACTWLV